MGPLDFIFGLLLLGTVTGITKMVTTALAHRTAPNRVRSLEAQLHEARRQNDQFQKQLDWHNRLLETQDRLTAQTGVA